MEMDFTHPPQDFQMLKLHTVTSNREQAQNTKSLWFILKQTWNMQFIGSLRLLFIHAMDYPLIQWGVDFRYLRDNNSALLATKYSFQRFFLWERVFLRLSETFLHMVSLCERHEKLFLFSYPFPRNKELWRNMMGLSS